jgi:hypothetical protein
MRWGGLRAGEYRCEFGFNPVRSAPLADGSGCAPMRRSRALRRKHIAPALGQLQSAGRRRNMLAVPNCRWRPNARNERDCFFLLAGASLDAAYSK